jgi:hypothetical protein
LVALISILLLAASLVGRAPADAQRAPQDYESIWRELAAIEALDQKDPARAERLQAIANATHERAQENSARGALLRATLARLTRGSASLDWNVEATWPYDREESWFAAAVSSDGRQRSRAVIAALGPLETAASEPALAPFRVQLAFDVWVDAADHLRYDDALAIGRNLHRRERATWSALSFSISCMRAGVPEEGDAALAGQIAASFASPSDLAALWDQRGIAALGAGWEARGRAALGHALIWGSSDASVVLARLDLAAGRSSDARTGFRAVLCENPASDWARRGFGLSLIPTRAGTRASATPGW